MRTAKRKKIKLPCTQKKRHDIFKWYFKKSKEMERMEWQSFINKYKKEFSSSFKGKEIAPPKSRIRNNLQDIIKWLSAGRKEIKNVLLFFKSKDSTVEIYFDDKDCNDFQNIIFPYPKIQGSELFEMG